MFPHMEPSLAAIATFFKDGAAVATQHLFNGSYDLPKLLNINQPHQSRGNELRPDGAFLPSSQTHDSPAGHSSLSSPPCQPQVEQSRFHGAFQPQVKQSRCHGAFQPSLNSILEADHRAPAEHSSSLNPGACCFQPGGSIPRLRIQDVSFSNIEDMFLHSDHPDTHDDPEPCQCHGLPVGSCEKVINEYVHLVSAVRAHPSGLPNMDGARIEIPNKELDPNAWDRILGSFYNKDRLVCAFRYGWDMSLLPDPSPRNSSQNHPSAMEHASHVSKYVVKELQFGALVGPLPDNLPFETFRSPFGSVPKNEESRRTITDGSLR